MSVTDEEFEAIVNSMPEEMDENEVCAMILTICTAYIDDHSGVMSTLVTAIYTYGDAIGAPREKISATLRKTADLYDSKQKPKKH